MRTVSISGSIFVFYFVSLSISISMPVFSCLYYYSFFERFGRFMYSLSPVSIFYFYVLLFLTSSHQWVFHIIKPYHARCYLKLISIVIRHSYLGYMGFLTQVSCWQCEYIRLLVESHHKRWTKTASVVNSSCAFPAVGVLCSQNLPCLHLQMPSRFWRLLCSRALFFLGFHRVFIPLRKHAND